MTPSFKFRERSNLLKQLILNSIPEFINLVQETSSVKLIDSCNSIHNDRKIVFLTDGSAFRESDQLLPAGIGNRDLLRDIRHKGINTG